MDPFALVSAVGTCYEYANWIIDFCQTWKNADEEVAERVNIIESCWAKTRLQVMLIQRTRPIMDAELLRVLDESLDILREKLTIAVAKLQNVQDNKSEIRPGFFGFRRRARGDKWALEKDTLDSVIRDLEDWQRRCDPSWFLIMRIANPVIDEELQKAEAAAEATPATSTITGRFGRGPPCPSPLSLAGGIRDALRRNGPHRSVFLPEMPLDTSAIPFSTAKTARKKTSSDHSTWYILDTLKFHPGPDTSAVTDDVRDLARKLKRADPFTFGLLSCVGAIRVFERVPQTKEKRLVGFELVLRAPGGVDAQALCSLRELLVKSADGGGAVPSLTRRVCLAQELAKSVSYMHTFDFVHKNICPESVLVNNSTNPDSPRNRRSSFLVGFGSFRSAGGGTRLLGDEAWERNIYRHPERQGENPSQKFKMQHDIYSLGVCLLEIGLWQSFVEHSDNGTPVAKFGKVCQDFVDNFIKEHQVAVGASQFGTSQFGIAFVFFKDYLVDLARVELPHRMGERYAEVVVACLTCLDTDSDGFGDLSDKAEYTDGITLGVRFLEVIHIRLDEIVL
ncbi:hypothetical protein B0H67DRAFT_594051 [Lasiosphaeris hirsuta]|uniref:Protein kinase domain-containing protein n=1 Tax=Lasiosphaeris hirsuta TaxID=260670 RepID=A0AA39ZXF6_9PEZI|nr:hypothetical protein B0H67DRAFT_594051 [Lasiosphaeris hirsuta]